MSKVDRETLQKICYHLPAKSVNQFSSNARPSLPVSPILFIPVLPFLLNLPLHILSNPLQIRRNHLHLHAGRALQIPQLLSNPPDQLLQIRPIVLVFELAVFAQRREQRLIGREVIEEGCMRRQGFVERGVDTDARFVRPETRDVAGGVAAAAEDEQWEVEGLDEGDAGAVGADVEIEAAQSVAAEGVGAALEHDGRGSVVLDAGTDDVAEEADVVVVFDAVVEGDVERVMGAWVERVERTGRGQRAGAGEEAVFVVFVEGEGHDAVGGPEGLLDAVAVVDVDVDVEDARVVAQELEDGEHDVVDVAEARGFGFLGVVEPTGPVDRDAGLVVDEFARGVDGGAGVEGTVAVESVEDGTVVADVVVWDLFGQRWGGHGFWRHSTRVVSGIAWVG